MTDWAGFVYTLAALGIFGLGYVCCLELTRSARRPPRRPTVLRHRQLDRERDESAADVWKH